LPLEGTTVAVNDDAIYSFNVRIADGSYLFDIATQMEF
jgi:hypothetical protein